MEKKQKKLTKTDKLKEECAEYLAGWKRAQADYQNLLKESSLQKVDLIKNANQTLILELLPILDNFKMAFGQIPEKEEGSPWVIGFSHIRKQFEDLLNSYGVEVIKTVGEQFNTEEHEAIESREEKDKADDLVLEERKPGYKLNGKVIQVANVIVNSLDKK
mgnify:CR=1 FL=1